MDTKKWSTWSVSYDGDDLWNTFCCLLIHALPTCTAVVPTRSRVVLWCSSHFRRRLYPFTRDAGLPLDQVFERDNLQLLIIFGVLMENRFKLWVGSERHHVLMESLPHHLLSCILSGSNTDFNRVKRRRRWLITNYKDGLVSGSVPQPWLHSD